MITMTTGEIFSPRSRTFRAALTLRSETFSIRAASPCETGGVGKFADPARCWFAPRSRFAISAATAARDGRTRQICRFVLRPTGREVREIGRDRRPTFSIRAASPCVVETGKFAALTVREVRDLCRDRRALAFGSDGRALRRVTPAPRSAMADREQPPPAQGFGLRYAQRYAA